MAYLLFTVEAVGTDMEREQRIFISHSSEDHPITMASVKALEQCGFKVWYYEENQEYGDLRR